MALLEVKNLTKNFGGLTAVGDVSMELNEGELVGLIGPNGAGKTTTIRMLVGLIHPNEGSISICGHDLKNDTEKALREVGAVVENPELYKLEVSSCRKIYKTEFLEDNKFFFPEKLKWEDVPGHFYLLNKANTCMALPEVGFFYRTNQGGQITSGGGKTRLDMVLIFEQLLKVQEENNFIEIERAYVLRLILDFSLWSVEATNVEYIVELLNKLHIFWKKIDKNDLQFYLDNLSQNKEVEKGFVASLMSENYLKLKEYAERYDVMRKYSRVFNKDGEKRNIIKGGLKCVQEHGLKYTISWALEKSQLR